MPLFLRASSEVNLISVEQQSYGDYLKNLPDPTAIFTVSVQPLRGVVAIEINSAVAFPIVDRMLGGGGAALAEMRAAPEIEQRILEGFIAVVTELSIAAAGFAPSEIELNCPSKILIRGAAQQLDSNLLREALEKAVLTRFAAEKVAARVTKFDSPENLQLPQGSVTVRADVSTVRNFFQPFAALFEISVDGHVARRTSANVQVEATVQVRGAARDLSLNSKISESDVRAENRKLEKPLENYLRGASKLRGMMMLKNLSAGTELTTDAVTAGIAVKNGDTVRVIGQSGKLQISISGEARASGRIGDRITVKNPTSNVILQAIIVDEGLVKVNF